MDYKTIGYLLSCLLFLLKAGVIQAGEYCSSYNSYSGNYDVIYCTDYCCSGNSSCCTANVGTITGCVIGGIIFICIIFAIVMVCKKHHGRQGVVIQPQDTRTTTTVTHVHQPPQQPQPGPQYYGGPQPGGGQYPPPNQYPPPQPQQDSVYPPPPQYPPPPAYTQQKF